MKIFKWVPVSQIEMVVNIHDNCSRLFVANQVCNIQQKKKGKDSKMNKENDSSKKETSFISFSGEDSNTSMDYQMFCLSGSWLIPLIPYRFFPDK